MTRDDRDDPLAAAIRDQADYHRAPASLREEVLAALPHEDEPAPRPAWRFWLAQGAALAGVAFLTWAATFAYLRPSEDEGRAEDILAAHVRATLEHRLIEVASSDQHTVKPWLSARLPYSPPVPDLSAQGFQLAGARLDRARGQPVAVLVYQRRQHVIDAYVWPARGGVKAAEFTHDGFHLARFAAGEMAFWVVSDLNRNELKDFADLLARRNAD
jgi:anti-sigma factor RsiW